MPRDRIELPTRGFSVLRGGKDSGGLDAKQGGRVASTVAATAPDFPSARTFETDQEAVAAALSFLETGRLDLARRVLVDLRIRLEDDHGE
jgi:hypothetical protein